jgi:hypothetical protein
VNYCIVLSMLCLNVFAGEPSSCPATIFITGNNGAASQMRELAAKPADRPYLKLVSRQDKAEAVVDVSQVSNPQGTNVSATLTTTQGDLVWSGATDGTTGWTLFGGTSHVWDKLERANCAAESKAWKKSRK